MFEYLNRAAESALTQNNLDRYEELNRLRLKLIVAKEKTKSESN